MPFQVSIKTWMEVELARVRGIILMPRFWHRSWTDQSLKEALKEIGLEYSLPEVRLLNDALHTQGIVEDVAEPPPPPTA